ncbi:hypothetical protein OAG16_03810 [Saprospiraceae bacterium]|nr:hypothetical protein [Saprospiraceae bacterium]
MTDDSKKENTIIPISSSNLVRVGSSIEITNKIIAEHKKRTEKTVEIKEGNESIQIKLTKEILETISPREIIYAEVAGGGAMGNSGGIMIYVVNKEQLICYETSVFNDEEVYLIADDFVSKNERTYFNYYYGGMGNNVFVNKDAELNTKQEYFSYLKNGFEYKIYSSVKGVFNSVVNKMKNPNSETH